MDILLILGIVIALGATAFIIKKSRNNYKYPWDK